MVYCKAEIQFGVSSRQLRSSRFDDDQALIFGFNLSCFYSLITDADPLVLTLVTLSQLHRDVSLSFECVCESFPQDWKCHGRVPSSRIRSLAEDIRQVLNIL